ncbi:MAG: hypothetical protein HYV03_03350 [Deltaproteobacteria bacterium]|nr:hypothetical protein [Deltaproteobacteria bacterium]
MNRIVYRLAILLSIVCAPLAVPAQPDTGSVAGMQAAGAVPGGGRNFTIELKGADLKEALRFLARVAGLNVMIPEGVGGIVNAAFDSTSVLDAINSISKANGLDYAIERGILRVGKTEQFSTSGEDLKTETIRLKFANAKQMVDKVKGLLTQRGSAFSDDRTNSMVVRETLANIEHVRRFLENVDVRDAQVLIQARIVEATRDWSRSLGIQWGVNMAGNKVNVVGVQSVGLSDGGRNLMVNVPAAGATSGGGLAIGNLPKGLQIDLAITAAEQKGDLHVISEPQIVTSNGVSAKIRSGETIYVKTAGSVSIGASSAAPDFTRQVDGIPAIIDNKANTTVLVRDGETTVIGGLMKWRQQDQRRKVPYMGDIPLLGNLFKSRTRSKTNSELMIFIRPNVVADYTTSPLMYDLPNVEDVKQDSTLKDQPHRKPDKAIPEDGEGRRRTGEVRYHRYRTK